MFADPHSRERVGARKMGSGRKAALVLSSICITAILCLATGELLLRISGNKPWKYNIRRDDLVFHVYDPTLGWINRPGVYHLPSRRDNVPPFLMSFRDDGSRVTGTNPAPAASDRVYLLGGSFTEGLAVADNETYAWKLQSRFPRYDVRNYGTGGYGTYQSLLLLRKLLANDKAPRLVLYGLIDDHERRNVGSTDWLRALSLYKRQAATPYVSISDSGTLETHGLTAYPLSPLMRHSALVRFAVDKFMDASASTRFSRARAATLALIAQLDKISRNASSTFAVIILSMRDVRAVDSYIAFMDANHIKHIDCNIPDVYKHFVPHWSHPDEDIHTRWADCVAASGVLSTE